MDDANTTTLSYTWAADGSGNPTNRIASRTVTYPIVSTIRNGSGTANTETTVFDAVGRPVWTKDAGGFITYTQYDPVTGAVAKHIDDVDTTKTADFTGLPSGWTTPTGGGLHLITATQSEGLGRPIKVTDPNGNITYTVYIDVNHETRMYTTASGTFAEVGPISIHRVYWPAQGAGSGQSQVYTEDITSSATPSLTGGAPDGTEAVTSSNIQTLSRSLTNTAGQMIERDQYTGLGAITYSALVATLGTAGINYLATAYAYDDRGRKKKTTAPDGTITRTIYDARNLVVGTWKGTNDTTTTGYWSPTNQAGANLLKISSAAYDVDGNMTQSRQVLTNDTSGNDSTYYQTAYGYDYRDRLTDMRGPDSVATKYILDNSGNQIETDTYADANSNFTIGAGELIGKSTAAYDDLGLTYQTTTYENARALTAGALVSSGTTATVTLANHGFATGQSVTIAGASQAAYNGTFSITVTGQNTFTYTLASSLTGTATGTRITVQADKRLTSNTWYDARGNVAKTQNANGLINKSFYDGASRLIRTDVTADPTETASGTYADALALTGDQVIEQNDYWLDKGGRTRIVSNWKRDGGQSSSTTGVPTADNYDHSAIAYWYDAANRTVASADYGRDGAESGAVSTDAIVWNQTGHSYKDANSDGIPDAIAGAQDAAPGWDNFSNPATDTVYRWITTTYGYDAAGRLATTTDNAQRVAKTLYDLAGRTTSTIADYTGTGAVTETTAGDVNQTTQYVYDAQGRLSQQIALDPKGSGNGVQQQKTTYLYGNDVDRSWVTATLYPDSADTTSVDSTGKGTVSSGTDHTSATYDRLGRQVTSTDQRGVVHTFAYDSAGRFSSDSIGTGTLPTGVDGAVRSIGYTYDDQSRVATVTSYDGSGTPVTLNQVAYTYDGWGNITRDAEEHQGAVTGSTPAVNYLFADGSGTTTTAKTVHLSKVLYAANNGTTAGTFVYGYETTNIGAALDRIGSISDGSGTQLVVYTWLGVATRINTIAHPQISGGLTFNDGAASGDYGGIDRFYRLAKMQWQTTTGGSNFEQRYGKYDRMGNLLRTDSNPTSTNGQSNFDQSYTYDGLNRLSGYKRGTLTSGTISSPTFTQSWTLDALGNWAGFSQTNNNTTLNPGTALATLSQTRTANAANEIGTFTGGGYASTGYDASGNQTQGPKGDAPGTQIGYVYDGWNRLVGVDATNNGSLTDANDVKYAYDGTGRRITKFTDSTNDSTNNAGSTEEYYQNEQNQVLEVRIGTVTAGVKTINANPKERYLWDLTYVDAPAMIELDTNTDGTRDNRLWATWDLSHNVSSLVTDGGKVVEHYVYTPYGTRTILNGSSNYAGTAADPDGAEWTADTNGSDFGFLLGFQGLRMDPESGNWYARARNESPAQGGWIERDPIGDQLDAKNLDNGEAILTRLEQSSFDVKQSAFFGLQSAIHRLPPLNVVSSTNRYIRPNVVSGVDPAGLAVHVVSLGGTFVAIMGAGLSINYASDDCGNWAVYIGASARLGVEVGGGLSGGDFTGCLDAFLKGATYDLEFSAGPLGGSVQKGSDGSGSGATAGIGGGMNPLNPKEGVGVSGGYNGTGSVLSSDLSHKCPCACDNQGGFMGGGGQTNGHGAGGSW